MSRDHNATSYSTETCGYQDRHRISDNAEIITLRAIALKLTDGALKITVDGVAEIITLRAIALKPLSRHNFWRDVCSRDHNATSYSTETY